MKKIAMIMSFMTMTGSVLYANEAITPDKPMLISSEVSATSPIRLNMNADITLAEFIITIMNSYTEEIPMLMDAHYATSSMLKAEELGLIDLSLYEEDTWLNVLTENEKMQILGSANMSGNFDMTKIYADLTDILIDELVVNNITIETGNLPHYKGHLMLPLRQVADAMGFSVEWDTLTSTATLSKDGIVSNIQVGYDNYEYTKDGNVVSLGKLGVTPLMRDGIVYIPVQAFEMFSVKEVVSNILYLDMLALR